MNNLQKSERTIALILSLLMERGIQHGIVNFSKEIDDHELMPFIGPCFRWLVSEGIVSAVNYAETKDSFGVVSPSLTSNGFRALGQPISVGENERTLAYLVEDVSKSGRSYSEFGDFFGGLLGGFTKSIGS